MALTVETGEGNPLADSFVTLLEVRAFASARGRSVSEVDGTLEAVIREVHDYLLIKESKFQGERSVENQALPFPRSGVVIHGHELDDDEIPQTLKNAVCQLVVENGTRPVLPSSDGKIIIQETLGPISTTYAQSGMASAQPVMPRVEAFLAPLYRSRPGQAFVTRV